MTKELSIPPKSPALYSIKEDAEDGLIVNTDTLAEIAAEKLIEKAKARIYHLFEDKKKIRKAQSSLDILMKRYQVQKSYFAKFVDWYASIPWWQKLMFSAAVTTVCALVGAIMHLIVGAIIGAISIICLLSAHFILKEHHQKQEQRNIRFCDDVLKREKKLSERLERLSKLEDELGSTLSELWSNSLKDSINNQNFENHLESLNELVEEYSLDEINLSSVIDSLRLTNEHLQSYLQQAREQIMPALDKTMVSSKSLYNTHENLIHSGKKLAQLIENIHHDLQTNQSKVPKAISAVTDEIKSFSEHSDKMRAVWSNKLDELTNDRVESVGQTDQLLIKAKEALAQSKSQSAKMSSSPYPSMFTPGESAALFSKVNEQLNAIKSHQAATSPTSPAGT